jgi:Spy/CpxP family protein refolding chaperone
MEKKVFKTIVMITALSFLMGVTSIAAATDASTTDSDTQQNITSRHRGEMRGMGNFERGSNQTIASKDLTDEQVEALQAERTAFQTATRDLRMEIQSKKLALQSELAKKEPDVKAAKSLQKEISALTAELAQKRIEHIVEMKKIAPYVGMGQLGSNTEDTSTPRGRRNT